MVSKNGVLKLWCFWQYPSGKQPLALEDRLLYWKIFQMPIAGNGCLVKVSWPISGGGLIAQVLVLLGTKKITWCQTVRNKQMMPLLYWGVCSLAVWCTVASCSITCGVAWCSSCRRCCCELLRVDCCVGWVSFASKRSWWDSFEFGRNHWIGVEHSYSKRNQTYSHKQLSCSLLIVGWNTPSFQSTVHVIPKQSPGGWAL